MAPSWREMKSMSKQVGKTPLWQMFKQTITEFIEDDCTRMAAAMSYYTAFSLAPLLIIVITICGVVWEEEAVQGQVQSELTSFLGSEGAAQVQTMLQHATQPEQGLLASGLSLIALLFGATGLVGQLQASLNEAWSVKPDPERSSIKDFLMKRFLSGCMILTIAFLLLVSLVISTLMTAMGDMINQWLPEGWGRTMLTWGNFLITLGVITLFFAAIYKVLPDAEIAWSDVWMGAGVTAGLFVFGKFLLGLYLGSNNVGTTFGAAGSLALILFWVYYSTMILMLGAEFTQVYAKTRGSGVHPSKGAVEVVEQVKYIRENVAT